MNNFSVVLDLIEHAKTHQITDGRFEALACSGMGLALRLPYGEVALFHEWVSTLGTATVNARRDINHPGELAAFGIVEAGHRVSVVVELDRRLLIDAKLLGRVELPKVEKLARELNPELVTA